MDKSITQAKIFFGNQFHGSTKYHGLCAKKSWVIGKDDKGYPVYKEGKNFYKFLRMKHMEVWKKTFLREEFLLWRKDYSKIGKRELAMETGFLRRTALSTEFSLFCFQSCRRYVGFSIF